MGCAKMSLCLQKTASVVSCIFGLIVLFLGILFLVYVSEVGDKEREETAKDLCDIADSTSTQFSKEDKESAAGYCKWHKEYIASASMAIFTGFVQMGVAGALTTSIDRTWCLWVALHAFILFLCIVCLGLIIHGRLALANAFGEDKKFCAQRLIGEARQGGEKRPETTSARSKDGENEKECAKLYVLKDIVTDGKDVGGRVYNAYFAFIMLDMAVISAGIALVLVFTCFVKKEEYGVIEE